MNIVIAYVVAIFLIGALSGLVTWLIATPLILKSCNKGKDSAVLLWFLMSFASGYVAIYLGEAWFRLMNVEFGFLALLAIYAPLLYNENRRSQGGGDHEKASLSGTVMSLLGAVIYG